MRPSTTPDVAVELAGHRVAAAVLEWRAGRPTVSAHASEPLPAGALADIVDRRRLLIAIQTYLLIVAGYWSDRNDLTKAFTKHFGEENAKRGLTTKKIPHHTDAQAYDIVYLLKQAMEKAKVTGDPSKVAAERTAIRDAMKGIRFTGVTGDNTCFNDARDAQLPGFIIEINNLQWNLFDQHAADACP